MSNKSPSKLFSWYYTIIISIVLLVGITATIWTYKIASLNAKEALLRDVGSIAMALDSTNISSLSGSEADLNNLHYISLKDKLEKIREINKNVTFIYLWGYRDGQIYFMVDSEPATSEDYSPPGQIYEEATLVDKQVLLKELPSAIEFSEDRWGSWLTALVPIMDGDKVMAVMGMDMSASNYYKNIYIYSAIPVISTIFVLLLMVIGWVLRKHEEKYLEFKAKLVSLATHDMRSPLTGVSWLLETMLGNKEGVKGEDRTNLEFINEKIKNLLHSVNELLASGDKKNNTKK